MIFSTNRFKRFINTVVKKTDIRPKHTMIYWRNGNTELETKRKHERERKKKEREKEKETEKERERKRARERERECEWMFEIPKI